MTHIQESVSTGMQDEFSNKREPLGSDVQELINILQLHKQTSKFNIALIVQFLEHSVEVRS